MARGARCAVRVDAAPRPVVARRELMPEEQAVIGLFEAARLDDYKPGDPVKLRVWREGKEIDVAAQLQRGD